MGIYRRGLNNYQDHGTISLVKLFSMRYLKWTVMDLKQVWVMISYYLKYALLFFGRRGSDMAVV